MSAVHDILSNELIREIISIRIDTLWKMIGLKRRDILPDVNDKGATGKFDNKGAIFVPGGLVYRDVDEQRIHYDAWTTIDTKSFRSRIRIAMRLDNATLCFPDGIAAGINLDSGFFSKVARRILTNKKAAYRRKKSIGRGVANEVGSADIIRSQCPPYMKPPYGARTRISTCVAIGLVDPPMFYAHCKDQHNLSTRQSEGFVKNSTNPLNRSRPMTGKSYFHLT
jgi:hypothetical protein